MTLVITTLTTGEWIVAIASGVFLLLFLVPVLLGSWFFVQMSDDTVARTIDDVQRYAKLKETAGTRLQGRRLGREDDH
jgi:hypothetical protein